MTITQDPIQFLTLAEAHEIDGAMLSTMEKFMTRITISSMRIITKIAQELNIHAEEIGASQIVQWIEHDSQIRKEQGEDAAFLKWTSPHPDLDFEDTRQDFVLAVINSALKILGTYEEEDEENNCMDQKSDSLLLQ